MTISALEKKITTALTTAGVDDERYVSSVKREAIEDIINQEVYPEALCDEFFITVSDLEVNDGTCDLPSDYLLADIADDGVKKVSASQFFNRNFSENVWTIAKDVDKKHKIFLNFAIDTIALRYIPKFSIEDGSDDFPLLPYWELAVVYMTARKILEDDQQYDLVERVKRKAGEYYSTAFATASREEDGEEGFVLEVESPY